MELKSNTRVGSVNNSFGSNRTFMELKFVERLERDESNKVLIVPLWN